MGIFKTQNGEMTIIYFWLHFVFGSVTNLQHVTSMQKDLNSTGAIKHSFAMQLYLTGDKYLELLSAALESMKSNRNR